MFVRMNRDDGGMGPYRPEMAVILYTIIRIQRQLALPGL